MGEQTKPLDMAEILMGAYQLADRINESEEVKRYLQLKERMDADPEVQRLIREFRRKKEKFEEAQRLAIFIRITTPPRRKRSRFRRMARTRGCGILGGGGGSWTGCLHEVSRTIARAVSESVRSRDLIRGRSKGGNARVEDYRSGGAGCSRHMISAAETLPVREPKPKPVTHRWFALRTNGIRKTEAFYAPSCRPVPGPLPQTSAWPPPSAVSRKKIDSDISAVFDG